MRYRAAVDRDELLRAAAGSPGRRALADRFGLAGGDRDAGREIPFRGGNERFTVVDGDFAMTGSELQPVLKALRHADIQIVAIHQHMTGEEPRIMFLHYWGIGRAEDLARGLRAALDQTQAE